MAAGRPRADSNSSSSSLFRDDYCNLPYFYSNFKDSNEVADFLKHKSKGKPGYFLLRPSFKKPNCLTVSVIVKDKSVRHTNIVIEFPSAACRQFYLVPEKRFTSVSDLMSFYKENDVKNLEKVSNVKFLYPVLRHTNRYSDYSSSSGGSMVGYPQTQDESPKNPIPIPDDRPQLPPRPDTLPRKPSGTSFGSQSSLPRNPSDLSPMNLGSSFGSQFSLPKSSVAGSPHNGFCQRGASFDRPVFDDSSPGAERPPAPMPPGFHKPGEKDPYYSHPRNVEEDISERLKDVLRQNERCDCGIPRDMSDLPMGWTLHRSKDQPTYGRIFFQNSAGLTSWKLPEEVQRKLTPTQSANLKKLQFIYKKHLSSSYLVTNHSDLDSDLGTTDTGNTHF